MTFVEVAFFFPCAICVISALWLLASPMRIIDQDRVNEAGRLGDLDGLRWNGWTLVKGWPPVTCWQGCSNLHRDDWWRVYLSRTCWHGCEDLHRDDWWKAYVDQGSAPDRAPVTDRSVT